MLHPAPRLIASSLVVIVAALLPSSLLAVVINPGVDLLRSEPGTYFDFSVQPIPAGFFDPGSQPFDGLVHFVGLPTHYPPCPMDPLADTIVRRLGPSNPPEVIPIELVQLSLVSVEPIRVTYDFGPDQFWNVNVILGGPSQGTMSVQQQHANGGTFTSQFFVHPLFTFTRVDSGDQRVLDPGPVPFAGSGPWWLVAPPPGSCTSNFCVSPSGPIVFSGPFGQHVVRGLCPSPPVGVDEGIQSSSWGRAKSSYR